MPLLRSELAQTGELSGKLDSVGGYRDARWVAGAGALSLAAAVVSAVTMGSLDHQAIAAAPTAAAPSSLSTPTASRALTVASMLSHQTTPAPSPSHQTTPTPSYAAARAATPSPTATRRAHAASLSGDIVFESDRGTAASSQPANSDGSVTPTSEGNNVWVMWPDGTHARPLTTTGFDSQGALSPDGLSVAWVHHDNELWLVRSDASEPHLLARCPLDCQQPRWSPDGGQLAYVAVDRGQRLRSHAMLIRVDGTQGHPVLPDLNPYMVTWSPDGRRLAVDVGLDGNNNGLYVADLATSQSKRIYGKDGFTGDSPDWSPDGSTILFSDGNDLYTIHPDGTSIHQLTGTAYENLVDEPGQHMSGSWSRDGTKIAFDYFAHSDTAKTRIGVMHADGTGEVLLTDNSAECSAPHF